MKIEGSGRSQQAGVTGKKEKASPGGGVFGSMLTGGAQEAQGAAASHSIASIDVLLAAQGAEDPAQGAAKKRMRKRADDVLGELDKIRLALLTGKLTLGHVVNIADVVASHREKVVDPYLTAILDEIDLRAQIELAKIRMALDQKRENR